MIIGAMHVAVSFRADRSEIIRVDDTRSGAPDLVACRGRDTNASNCPVILLRCARRWHPEIRDSAVQSQPAE